VQQETKDKLSYLEPTFMVVMAQTDYN
jgi:hypothetical protein